jgi:cell division septation protein DedD
MSRWRWGWGALALAVALVPGPADVAAQSLDTVDRLARSGQPEEARQVLTEWWEVRRSEASRRERQQGIWLRGLLTVDPAQARLDFQRLAVEYPAGPYTARALARLGRIADAYGDPLQAAQHYRSLLRDHPGGDGAEQAREWLAANVDRVEAAREAARRAAETGDEAHEAPSGEATDTAEAEPESESGPRREDPGEAAAEGPPADDPAAEAPAPGMPPLAAPDDVTIQLGAFSTEARARELVERLVEAVGAEAGLAPRVVTVEGSELIRVRVGRFATPEDATAVYDRLRARGFEALVVATAGRETRVDGEAGSGAG